MEPSGSVLAGHGCLVRRHGSLGALARCGMVAKLCARLEFPQPLVPRGPSALASDARLLWCLHPRRRRIPAAAVTLQK